MTYPGEQFIMAMAHRGRLNTLAHVLNKPYEVMLSEFEGTSLPMQSDEGDGDVKYHLGYANERSLPNAKVKVSLLPNPSHAPCTFTPAAPSKGRGHRLRKPRDS